VALQRHTEMVRPDGHAEFSGRLSHFVSNRPIWLAEASPLPPICPVSGSATMHRGRPPKTIVLDMDSSGSPTYGQQEGSVYNGHFGCTCYHPLFVFNQFGDVERCALRRP
jgi:hypothetical protein